MCENSVDSRQNWKNYRALLSNATPPCVPFIGMLAFVVEWLTVLTHVPGVFLSTLTFLNNGSEDDISEGLINFRKRQIAAEIIQNLKRLQHLPYNFQPIPSIQYMLEEGFKQVSDWTSGLDDHFWKVSLELEPREREEEMIRMLEEAPSPRKKSAKRPAENVIRIEAAG